MFVLGIDPGLSRCGYGIVERGGTPRSGGAHPAPGPGGGSARRQRAVVAGVLRTEASEPVPSRLRALRDDVRSLLREHRPEVVAVERVLFQVNVRTAIPVAQAAGVVMVEATDAGCEVVEYSPNQVKQAVTGMGGADKLQMQRMVQMLLGMPELPRPPDAADALGLAICHLAQAPLAAGPGARPAAAPAPAGGRAGRGVRGGRGGGHA